MKRTPAKKGQKDPRPSEPKPETNVASERELTQKKHSDVKNLNKTAQVNTITSIASVILVLVNIIVTTNLGVQQHKNQQEFLATQQIRDQEFQEETQKRNEDFQKQFAELQIQNQFAKIEITQEDVTGSSSGNAITVENQGPATATNLIIAVCIQNIHFFWQDHISEIEQFQISLTNPAIKHTQEYKHVDNCPNPVTYTFEATKHNVVLISVDSLPPNQEIIININRPMSLYKAEQGWEMGLERQVFIMFDKNRIGDEVLAAIIDGKEDINPSFDKMTSKVFEIARLWTSVRCDNCVGNTNYENYLTISSLSRSFISKFEVVRDTTNYLLAQADVELYFLITPSGIFPIAFGDFYLLGYGDILTFMEIDQNQFESTETYQCNDALDNDNDFFIDYPADPDCKNPYDDDESN
ncbi:MAG TPA: hypothetical protein PKE62_05160 [Anaerolineales bacterium]|nr:hypothetical protein [Anaerolineales bacterium]